MSMLNITELSRDITTIAGEIQRLKKEPSQEALGKLKKIVDAFEKTSPLERESLALRHQFVHTFSQDIKGFDKVRAAFGERIYTRVKSKKDIKNPWLSVKEQAALFKSDTVPELYHKAAYFHATNLTGLRGILESKKIKVQSKSCYSGAFVSSQPEYCYGDLVLIFNRKIEHMKPVLRSGCHNEGMGVSVCWVGFANALPIDDALVGVAAKYPSDIPHIKKNISTWLGREIEVIPLENLKTFVKERNVELGVQFPCEWNRDPNISKTTGAIEEKESSFGEFMWSAWKSIKTAFSTLGISSANATEIPEEVIQKASKDMYIPTVRDREELDAYLRSLEALQSLTESLTEEGIEEQFKAALKGSSDESIHPDIKKAIKDFRAFERQEMREEAYGAFGEGFNKLAQNRFLSKNLKKVATAGTHVLDACKHFEKLDQLSRMASSTAISAAMGGHIFAIGVAAFSVMTLFVDDEDEAPQGNQMQDLTNMIAAGFFALSEQLRVMQSDIDEIKRAVQVDLPNLITGAAKRLSMQMGNLYSAMTSIEKNLESRLEAVHSLLLDVRKSEDERSVWQVESELGSILAEIKTTKTRYTVTPEAFSNVQELVRRLGPILENWILMKAESAFYTGGHRLGSNDISRELWASSTGPGWNIKTVAPTEALPNPEIVITAATLYSRLRKMAVLYKIPYDGEAAFIQSIQTKVNVLYTRVAALSSGSSLNVYITDLKTHSATWTTRVQAVLREEMTKQRKEILDLWDLDAQIEEARESFPPKDLLGRSWSNFTDCVGGPWTQFITPLLAEGCERLESDLESITPAAVPALDVASSRLQVPSSLLLPIAFPKTPFVSMPEVAISIPDEVLSTLPMGETLLSGEALGCWRVKFSYTIARFQVDARPVDSNWDDWMLFAMDTTRNSNLSFDVDAFCGTNDDLIGKVARFSVNVRTALQFADQKKEEVVVDSMMVVDVKTIRNDIYYDMALGNWYSYSLLILFERGLREGKRTVINHEVKTRKNLDQMVKDKKEALYKSLIKKVKEDPTIICETQFIARRAAELKAALSFVDAPEPIGKLALELFSNPASWLTQDPLKPWVKLPQTPSFVAVNNLLLPKLIVPTETSIDTSITLLEKVVARMVRHRTPTLVGVDPLQAHDTSLVKKLRDVKQLLPATFAEARAAAGMIAIEAAKPRETAMQTNDLVLRLLDENADLRQRLARMEELLIRLASK